MNSSVYIFGDLTKGYSQYPSDYTAELFKDFIEKGEFSAQIIVHRKDKLVYHTYVKRINENESTTLGLCVVYNDCLFGDLTILHEIFEEAFKNVTMNSRIFEFSDNGNLVPIIDYFYRTKKDLSNISELLLYRISEYNKLFEALPPNNFEIDSNSTRSIGLKDSKGKIGSLLKSANIVFCTSTSESNDMLFSYTSKIKELNDKNLHVTRENRELKEKNLEIIRKKKQYNYIIVLIGLVLLCIIGLLSYRMNVNVLKKQLFTEKSNISNLTQENTSLLDNIDSIVWKNKQIESELRREIKTIKIEKDSLQANVSRLTDENKKNKKEFIYIQQKYDKLRREINNSTRYNKEFSTSKSQNLESYDTYKNQVTRSHGLVITRVEIANVRSDDSFFTYYGREIQGYFTMYLKPRIYYTASKAGTVSLTVKWFNPDGTRINGIEKKENIVLKLGTNYCTLSKIGGDRMGQFARGTYRIEIWGENSLLINEKFSIK